MRLKGVGIIDACGVCGRINTSTLLNYFGQKTFGDCKPGRRWKDNTKMKIKRSRLRKFDFTLVKMASNNSFIKTVINKVRKKESFF
jgi:hypothetical protein